MTSPLAPMISIATHASSPLCAASINLCASSVESRRRTIEDLLWINLANLPRSILANRVP
jgi:hypothetical protein